jgi:hypothetical protein
VRGLVRADLLEALVHGRLVAGLLEGGGRGQLLVERVLEVLWTRGWSAELALHCTTDVFDEPCAAEGCRAWTVDSPQV